MPKSRSRRPDSNVTNEPKRSRFERQNRNDMEGSSSHARTEGSSTVANSVKDADFMIIVGGVSFPVHKKTLISSSEYFRGMLAHDTIERQDGFVEIKEIDSQTMKLCINFMCDCDIDVTMETAKNLLPAADFLQLTELSKRCIDVLKSNLKPGNCITVLKLARAYNCYELAETALDIFKREFKMENYKDFRKLDKEGIKQHVNDLDMEIAWDGIINWIKLDVENRSSDIVELVKMLNWESFPSGCFLHSVWSDSHFKTSRFCRNFVFKSLFLDNALLEKEINIENCLIIEKIASDFPFLSKDAKQVIFDFMSANLPILASKPEFTSLSKGTILSLFSSNEVGLYKETLRWNAALKWMKNNLELKESFFEILNLIRFEQIPKNYLKSKVLTESSLLTEIPVWDNRFLHFLVKTSKDKAYISALYPDGAILAWDNSNKSWLQHKLPNCPKTGKNTRMFSFCDKLCILVDKELFYFGKNETKWIPLAVMNHYPEANASIVSTDDKIYVVEKERMSCYDPNTNAWNESLPGCGLDRKLLAGCTQDCIQVHNTNNQNRFFFFCKNKWEAVGNARIMNSTGAMASSDGRIFVVGLQGYDSSNRQYRNNGVECYRNGWKDIRNTPVSINGPSHLFFVDGQLFLLVSKTLYHYVDYCNAWINLGNFPEYGHRVENTKFDPVSVCSFKGNLGNVQA